MTATTPSFDRHATLLVTAIVVCSILVLPVLATGGPVAAQPDEYDRDAADRIYDEPDHDELDGELIWQGQIVLISGLDPGEDYQLREGTPTDDDGLAAELTADANGTIQLDTAVRDEGDHYIRGEFVDGDEAVFEIVEQSIGTFEFDPRTVNPGTETELTIDSNRATYTAYLRSDEIGSETLADAIDGADHFAPAGVAALSDPDDVHTVDTAEFPENENATVELVVPDSTATASETLVLDERIDDSVVFADRIVHQERGDWATIEYAVEGGDESSLRIGSDDVGFNVTVDATVDDRGEPIEVRMNTYQVARAGVPVEEAFEIENVAESEIELHSEPFSGDRRLEAGSYDLEVRTEEASEVGTLTLHERSTDEMTAHVAPASESLDDADEIRERVSTRDTVADEDTLVLQVEASGLYGYLLDEDGGLATDEGLDFVIEQNESAPNTDPAVFDVTALDDDTVSFVEDPDNNQFFAVIDTEAVEQGGNELEIGSEYEAIFSVHYHNDYVALDELDELATTTFTVEERTVTFDSEPIEVEAGAPNGTVAGTASVAPGSELTVSVRTDDSEYRFTERERVTVQSDGTWEATFEETFTTVPENVTFSVAVTGAVEGEIDGIVVDSLDEPDDDSPTPTATPDGAATPTPTETPTETQAADSGSESSVPEFMEEDVEDEDGPGFGIIAALLAVLAAIGVAVRSER